jgi:RES domain
MPCWAVPRRDRLDRKEISQFKRALLAIDELRALDLLAVDYSDIRAFIEKRVAQFPLTTCVFPKGSAIYRARKNSLGISFENQSQISYQPTAENITEFGRTSRPGLSVFYASMDSDTALYEVSSARRQDRSEPVEEVITVGAWLIKSDLHLVQFIHHEKAQTNPVIKKQHQHLDKVFRSQGPEAYEHANSILRYFSDEFARFVGGPHEYKISCAFFETVMETNKWSVAGNPDWHTLDGALYPSVRKKDRGLNLSLTTAAVNAKLELYSVAEFRIRSDDMLVSLLPLCSTRAIGPDGAFRLQRLENQLELILANLD